MPTKITVKNENFSARINGGNNKQIFLCQEPPRNVLETVVGKYNVDLYKHLWIPKTYLFGENQFSFEIEDLNLDWEGLSVDKSISDYDFSKFYSKEIHEAIQKEKKDLVELVKKLHFVYQKTEHGPIFLNKRSEPEGYNKKILYNYFEERKVKENRNPEKEKMLKDYYEFSEALIKSK